MWKWVYKRLIRVEDPFSELRQPLLRHSKHLSIDIPDLDDGTRDFFGEKMRQRACAAAQVHDAGIRRDDTLQPKCNRAEHCFIARNKRSDAAIVFRYFDAKVLFNGVR